MKFKSRHSFYILKFIILSFSICASINAVEKLCHTCSYSEDVIHEIDTILNNNKYKCNKWDSKISKEGIANLQKCHESFCKNVKLKGPGWMKNPTQVTNCFLLSHPEKFDTKISNTTKYTDENCKNMPKVFSNPKLANAIQNFALASQASLNYKKKSHQIIKNNILKEMPNSKIKKADILLVNMNAMINVSNHCLNKYQEEEEKNENNSSLNSCFNQYLRMGLYAKATVIVNMLKLAAKVFPNENVNPYQYLSETYPNLTRSEAVEQEQMKIQESIKKMSNKFGESLLDNKTKFQIYDIPPDDLSKDDIKELISNRVMLDLFSNTSSYKVINPLLRRNLIKKLPSYELPETREIEDKFYKKKNQLIFRILVNAANQPSKKDISKLENDLPFIVDQTISSLSNLFSKSSLTLIKKEVNNINFEMPFDQTSFLNDIEKKTRNLKLRLTELETSIDNLSEIEKILHAKTSYLELSNNDIAPELERIQKQELVDDHFYSLHKKIKVGGVSCSHLNQGGKSIIAHEIGHFISHLLKKKKVSLSTSQIVKETKQCLTRNHIEEFGEKKSLDRIVNFQDKNGSYETGFFTEEDFADFVSNNAYPEDAYKMTCLLTNTYGNKLLTKNTSVNEVKTYQELFLPDTNGDPHSQLNYRFWYAMRASGKQLPKSCQQIAPPIASCRL